MRRRKIAPVAIARFLALIALCLALLGCGDAPEGSTRDGWSSGALSLRGDWDLYTTPVGTEPSAKPAELPAPGSLPE